MRRLWEGMSAAGRVVAVSSALAIWLMLGIGVAMATSPARSGEPGSVMASTPPAPVEATTTQPADGSVDPSTPLPTAEPTSVR